MNDRRIKVAIAGVGNFASSLVQVATHYRANPEAPGVMHEVLGGFRAGDIEAICAFDAFTAWANGA